MEIYDSDVERFAEFFEVDPKTEPKLLKIVRKSLTDPLPPYYELIRDQAGILRFHNECTMEYSDTHPGAEFFRHQIDVMRPRKQRSQSITEASVTSWTPETMLQKSTSSYELPGMTEHPFPIPDPRFGPKFTLSFTHKWTEYVGSSPKSCVLDIKFQVFDCSVVIHMQGDNRCYELTHLTDSDLGGVLEPWDLYVGARIHLLGRTITLHSATASTVLWLSQKAYAFSKLRVKLMEVMKECGIIIRDTTDMDSPTHFNHSEGKVRIRKTLQEIDSQLFQLHAVDPDAANHFGIQFDHLRDCSGNMG
eukprot:TRINITY_DN776121_c0_g1_i1.p1 TRINITY_DN776121_c0_g1~~TRINITY_DN776121_c0_g1_i1.p1  ORF type:complete len:305 (+),score=45.72 TRINITY_DN776121_c0_g1_i1:140-1054(+)